MRFGQMADAPPKTPAPIVALPSPRDALKATRFAGGFAGLDRFARRWRLAYHDPLVSGAAGAAATAHQRIMVATCHAGETQSSRRDRSEAEKRRSRLTAARRRGPPPQALVRHHAVVDRRRRGGAR